MRESLYLEGNEQLIEILQNIPAFEAFSTDSINSLLRLSKIRTYQPQELIIEEGGCEKSMYLLISGSVVVFKQSKQIMNLKRTGDIFGEMSLLGEEPRSASVRANAESSCLVIDAEYLDSLDYDGKQSFHAAMYQMFAQILAYRLRLTTDQYTEANQKIERLEKEIASLKKF